MAPTTPDEVIGSLLAKIRALGGGAFWDGEAIIATFGTAPIRLTVNINNEAVQFNSDDLLYRGEVVSGSDARLDDHLRDALNGGAELVLFYRVGLWTASITFDRADGGYQEFKADGATSSHALETLSTKFG